MRLGRLQGGIEMTRKLISYLLPHPSSLVPPPSPVQLVAFLVVEAPGADQAVGQLFSGGIEV